jgi:hypothetical protein
MIDFTSKPNISKINFSVLFLKMSNTFITLKILELKKLKYKFQKEKNV